MLFGRKKTEKIPYDKDSKKPAIRASICTGEKVAGFVDIVTGRFEEVAFIANEGDLEAFRDRYGITDKIETIY